MSTRYVAALGSPLFVALAVPSQASIPRMLPYQGVLNDSLNSQPNCDPIRAGGKLHLSITDDGIGIAEDQV